MPVRAEHDARQPDRVDALAPDVTDDHAYAVRGVQRLVQVAADVGGRARRDVPAGDRQLTDLWADRAQHRLLGDGGEPGQFGVTLVLRLPDNADGHGAGGGDGHGHGPSDRHVVQTVVRQQRDQEGQGRGEQAHPNHVSPGREGRGQEGSDGEPADDGWRGRRRETETADRDEHDDGRTKANASLGGQGRATSSHVCLSGRGRKRSACPMLRYRFDRPGVSWPAGRVQPPFRPSCPVRRV